MNNIIIDDITLEYAPHNGKLLRVFVKAAIITYSTDLIRKRLRLPV
jgi:hypothetical protein